jgi:prepilin-type N-terminal cleavage/methylation domain-containing protein
MIRPRAGFTLLELMIAISIAALIIMVAVPSVEGIVAERKLTESFEKFDALTRKAMLNSVQQQRTWVIVWGKNSVSVQPDAPLPEERANDGEGVREDLVFGEDEHYKLEKPASLLSAKETPAEWTFWRSGTCEPVFVVYEGPAGKWRAQYSPLTGYGEIIEQEMP